MKARIISGILLIAIFLTGCGNGEAAKNTPAPVIPTMEAQQEDDKLKDEKEDLEDLLQETPGSTCFSRVGYYEKGQLLFLEFRESGYIYEYGGFSAEDWESFIGADSLGGYFNENIKGEYTYDRIY